MHHTGSHPFDQRPSSSQNLKNEYFDHPRELGHDDYPMSEDDDEFSFLRVDPPPGLPAEWDNLYIPIEAATLHLQSDVHLARAPVARDGTGQPAQGPSFQKLVTIGIVVTLGLSMLTKQGEGMQHSTGDISGARISVVKPDGKPDGKLDKKEEKSPEAKEPTSKPGSGSSIKKNDDPGIPPRPTKAEEKKLSEKNASENCDAYAPDISKLPYGAPAVRPPPAPPGAVLHGTRVTFYLPKPFHEYKSRKEALLEGGPLDRRGVPLVTIEEHLKTGKRVSVAMDAKSSFKSIYGYGTEVTVYYPGLSKLYPALKDDTFPAVIVDTGCAFSYTQGRKVDVAIAAEKLATSHTKIGVWWVDGKRKTE